MTKKPTRLTILITVQLYHAPVSGDLTLLKVLVLALLAEEVDDNVFELDKSSNWYSPGGTFPVLYLG